MTIERLCYELSTATGARYEFVRAGYPLDELDAKTALAEDPSMGHIYLAYCLGVSGHYWGKLPLDPVDVARWIIDLEWPQRWENARKAARRLVSDFLLMELRQAAREQWRVHPDGQRPNRAERRRR